MYAQKLVGATINLVNAVASAGTTTTITTTTGTTHVIKGKFGTSFASGTNTAVTWGTDAATGNAFIPLAANQTAALVIGINAAGAAKMCQGPITATAVGVTTTAGAFLSSPQFPELPDDFCPICYTIVRTSPTGNAFTAGTTGWAASGITCSTFTNVAVLPDRPQTT